MRRLLVLAAVSAAALSFTGPASADHDCRSQAYGVWAGDVRAGVCAGGYCTDLCFIELQPYCEGDVPVAGVCVE